MYMPFVNPGTQKSRRQVVRFGGLNRTQNFQEGELADGVGLSCREWPCLSQRLGRKTVRQAVDGENSGFAGVFAWDQLVTVTASGELDYGGKSIGLLTPGKKQFAAVNTKLCIFPDKKYLDLSGDEVTLKDLGAKAVNMLGQSAEFGADTLSFVKDMPVAVRSNYMIALWPTSETPKNMTGDTYFIKVYDDVRWNKETGSWEKTGEKEVNLHYQRAYASPSQGISSLVGKYVILCDAEDGYAEENVRRASVTWNHTMETTQDYRPESQGKYGVITEVSVTIKDANYSNPFEATEILLTIEGYDGANPNDSLGVFEAGDVVTISGCETLEENNVDIRISAVEDTKITFDSPVLTPGIETGAVTLERKIPDLDYICESNNRLVGVSNADKTIYISALGDPRNFYDYRGLSVSSSYIPVGSSGDFTGCIAYGGNVLLMKEDCMHRLMGDYDGNYALYTDQVAGVQAGSAGSMVILNEVLYYKGREGVYAYTGATPSLISAALGDVHYQNAAAGTDGQRYYISMERTDTKQWELLAYDTRMGLWMLEERRQVGAFAWKDGRLYLISDVGLYALGDGEADEGLPGTENQAIAWEAIFTPFDETSHERKYPSRLLLRFELEEGAWVEAELSRDGGPFQHIWASHRPGPTAVIPIRSGRCDKYQLRIKGAGRCVIRSMAREFSLGGVR